VTVAAQPLPNVVDEARRFIHATDAEGVRVRLLGGGAFGLHIHRSLPDRLRRTYGDLDVAVGSRDSYALARLLPNLGYAPDERFNALHGEKRFLFRDMANDRKLDVFIGTFSMCHTMNLEGHLPADGMTLQVTDLLLTKLQVVEINPKDTLDALVLLRDHDLGPAPNDDCIEVERMTAICGGDWGWYTTVGDNLVHIAQAAPGLLDPNEAEAAIGKCRQLALAIAECPKSRGWRLRAMIGRRMEWYMLPEEIG
jgi:hypothetical protein